MEDTIRKTMPRRNVARQRRKSKPIYNYKIIRKVLIQLIMSGLILIFILGTQNINIPAAKEFNTSINSLVHKSLDFSMMSKGIGSFVDNIYNQGKDLFQKKLKSQQPVSDKNSVKDKETNLPLVDQKNGSSIISETSPSSITSNGNKAKKAGLVLSSISSSDMDARSIKSRYIFIKPVKGTISSPYGLRIHPITKKEEFHPGLDIKANKGTPIYAALGGTVIEARKGLTFGYFVRIQSGKDVKTVYAHCKKLLVKTGQRIKRGQKIAEVGDTGLALGAHLHFEIWKDERPVNPVYIVSSYGIH